MNKQESKYQYTASLMDEALLLLLEQKEFDAITVKKVCQKAGVNRSTFYLHYETMNDLLEETVGMINDRFKASLASVPTDDPTKVVLTSEQYLRPYLSFIKENMRAYQVIHQKEHLFNSQKTFQSFYETSLHCRSRSCGMGVLYPLRWDHGHRHRQGPRSILKIRSAEIQNDINKISGRPCSLINPIRLQGLLYYVNWFLPLPFWTYSAATCMSPGLSPPGACAVSRLAIRQVSVINRSNKPLTIYHKNSVRCSSRNQKTAGRE